MQNFISLFTIMRKKISTCYYKNEDSLGIAETTSEQIISTGSLSRNPLFLQKSSELYPLF